MLRSLTACGCIMLGRAVHVWLADWGVVGVLLSNPSSAPSSVPSSCIVRVLLAKAVCVVVACACCRMVQSIKRLQPIPLHASLFVCTFPSGPSNPLRVVLHCCCSSCCEQQQQQQHHKALASTPRLQWQCNSNAKSSFEWVVGLCKLLCWQRRDGTMHKMMGSGAIARCIRPSFGSGRCGVVPSMYLWLSVFIGGVDFVCAAPTGPSACRGCALPAAVWGLGVGASCADKYSGKGRIG